MKMKKLFDPAPTKSDMPRENPKTRVNNPRVSVNREEEEEVREMRNFFMNNVDYKRKQELCDSRMIQEDHNAFSNCSPNAINREWNPDEYCSRLAMFNQSTKTKR